jgi:hypothetical protein
MRLIPLREIAIAEHPLNTYEFTAAEWGIAFCGWAPRLPHRPRRRSHHRAEYCAGVRRDLRYAIGVACFGDCDLGLRRPMCVRATPISGSVCSWRSQPQSGPLRGVLVASHVSTRILSVVFGTVLLFSAYCSRRERTIVAATSRADGLADRLRMNSTYPTPDGP